MLPKPKAPVCFSDGLACIVLLLGAQQPVLTNDVWNCSLDHLLLDLDVAAVPELVTVVDETAEHINIFVQANWGVISEFLLVLERHFEEIVVLGIENTAVPAGGEVGAGTTESIF